MREKSLAKRLKMPGQRRRMYGQAMADEEKEALEEKTKLEDALERPKKNLKG